MKTLADYLTQDLKLLSVGLNPSLSSVQCGYPFSHPRNRFWPAFNAAFYPDTALKPSMEVMRFLVADGIGFTDVVKRPSAGSASLRADDYRRWCPLLVGKIEELRPAILWFHGKVAYAAFRKYGLGEKPLPLKWGWQPALLGARCYLSPNPSAANAAFSRDFLELAYRRLAAQIS
ncbi:MAG: mismatch-specific DNA-glycosylase [Pseudomonadota bacterium]